jgi:sugar lactone lactonase YvrE
VKAIDFRNSHEHVKTLLISFAIVGIITTVAAQAQTKRVGAAESQTVLSPNWAHSGQLVTVAQTNRFVWNGVTVSPDGRIFVNIPRALEGGSVPSVGVIDKAGEIQPYPGGAWNDWAPGLAAERAFVATNAVRVGPDGDLWIVDTGSPTFGGKTIAGGPKIVRIDLRSNKVVRIYSLDSSVAEAQSYLNDIRFNGRNAYIPDTGVPGLLVLDLVTGHARRVLDHDRSTTGTRPIVVDGVTVRFGPKNQPLIVNADQLEVSPDRRWLYYQPLSGPLWRVPTRDLDDESLTPAQVSRSVEAWYNTPALGDTAMDQRGNVYLNDAGNDTILKLTPDRRLKPLITDHRRLHWVDSPWIDHGWLYEPEAQLDRLPIFHNGVSQIKWPLHIYKLWIGPGEEEDQPDS